MKLHTTVLIGETRHARVLKFLALVLLACFAAGVPGTAAPSSALSSNRFLFIVDASASMKPIDDSVRQTVFDLIYSGARGRMTNGDSFGLWVVRDQNDTSYRMDVWRSRYAAEMGAKATTHLKEHGFKGKARLDLAIADAMHVVKNVRDLTVILVSNGETPIEGTPFDDDINARLRELAPQMKRAKATLNTALVAQDGAFVAWAVNSPDFLIDVPRVAPKPRPARTEIAAGTANAAMVTNGITKRAAVGPISTNPVPVERPRAATNPIIITKDTVAQEKRAWAVMTSTALNESNPPAATNGIMATFAKTDTIPSASNSVATVPALVPTRLVATNASALKVAAVEATEPVPKARTEPTNPVAAPATVDTVPTTERSIAAHPLAADVSPANGRNESNRLGFQPLVWIIAGAALAVICVLVGVLVARSHRRDASLISQAIAHQRVHSS